MERRTLVLDANILIRAVLGHRVRHHHEVHADRVSFFVPVTAYAEAEEHLAALVMKRGGKPAKALVSLRAMAALTTLVSDDLYGNFEAEARKRLGARDPEDWPVLAAALALGCPIWTEDTDFFGCGVATWTSGSIAIFLAQYRSSAIHRSPNIIFARATPRGSPTSNAQPPRRPAALQPDFDPAKAPGGCPTAPDAADIQNPRQHASSFCKTEPPGQWVRIVKTPVRSQRLDGFEL